MKKRGYTIIELIISVGLLIVAISIALFSTIGSSGLVQKADSRAAMTESGRAVSDTFRRVVENAAMSSVYLTGVRTDQGSINNAVWVKKFSREQAASVCHVIGRASIHSSLAGKYSLDSAGAMVAYWIARMDTNQNCPTIAELPAQALYQNRLTSDATVVGGFSAALTYNNPEKLVYPLLRYKLDIGLAERRGTLLGLSQPAPIILASAVPVGLVNSAVEPLTVDTSVLPDGNCGLSYSAQLQATGGQPNYSWQVVSGLPSGLSVSQSGGVTGSHTCNATVNYEITVRVRDSLGTLATRTVALKFIQSQGALIISSVSPLPSANKSFPYSFTFIAEGAGGFTWSISGNLPETALIDQASGRFTISTNSPNVTPGIYTFQVRVADAQNPSRSVTKDFTLQIVSFSMGGPI